MEEIIKELNEKLEGKYKFHFDMHHILKIKGIDEQSALPQYIFIGYRNSIINDSACMMSINSIGPIEHKNLLQMNKIVKWINEKIFTYSIHLLAKGKYESVTESVRLRIADNLIMKQDYLRKEDKLEWAGLVKDVYYNRKREMLNYYFTKIEEIPF